MVQASPWKPLGPENLHPQPATARNHANPTRGYPERSEGQAGVNRPGQRRMSEPEKQAAPLPVVQKSSSSNGSTTAPPSGSGSGDGGERDLPNPPATRERHTLRGPEEYPTDDTADQRFYIQRPDPKRGIVGDYPEGFDLQWIGIQVWGQQQPSIESTFLRKGWEPVCTGDFNGRYDGKFIPRSQQGPIMVDGLLLVARPMSWSNKAREIEERNARAPLQIKVRQITAGENDRITMGAQHKTALAFNHVNVELDTVSIAAPAKG